MSGVAVTYKGPGGLRMLRFVHIQATSISGLIYRNAPPEQLAIEIRDKSAVDVTVQYI
jgi:hypothetical protein